MNPASVVVGMCMGISVLVMVVSALQVRRAERRAEDAEERVDAAEAACAASEVKAERLVRLAAKHEQLITELTVMPGATVWSEWSGWTGWTAAQTVVEGRRIRVWLN